VTDRQLSGLGRQRRGGLGVNRPHRPEREVRRWCRPRSHQAAGGCRRM